MDHLEKPAALAQQEAGWPSDVAAQMLRALGIKYLSLNPGASYRGLHDSLVNHLGNRDPQMLLCLAEDHAVSVAHGYAKATDEAMGCVLHTNVGLMHGLMGIFNAWCDRAPMLVLGATGPVATEKRRPWIDWIHTARDQGSLLRDFTKWDDEPRSVEGIVEALLRATQMTSSEPRAPVYVCLDAGLQEEPLTKQVALPDPRRFASAPAPHASAASVAQIADMLLAAERPVLLFGRGSRDQADWDRRVELAERAGARTRVRVLTSLRERAVFPTEHPLHPLPPLYWLTPEAKTILRDADLIVSLDWVDLNGTLQQVMRATDRIAAKVVHVSLDNVLHKGWSLDYFGLPPVDVPVQAGADAFVGQLVRELQQRGCERATAQRHVVRAAEYSAKAASEIAPRDIEVALARAKTAAPLTLAHISLGWAGDAYPFRGPLDFLGQNGGAGLAAGPGLTVGAALALKDSGRLVVGVLGDGDFMQGASALWTAAHYGLPALFIVSNNRSNFNDELHQEAVARTRSRPVENRWIGQRIAEPAIDLAAIARAQGIEAEGPVKTVAELEAAIARGLAAVAAGRPYFIDAHVAPGYASPPLSRGE